MKVEVQSISFKSPHTHTHTQEYKTHSDESDAQRIEQIIQRALQDVDWVVKKVSLTISIILS